MKKWKIASLACLLFLACNSSQAPVSETFSNSPKTLPTNSEPETENIPLSFPLSSEAWSIVYDGFGSITFENGERIILEVQAPAHPTESHAALLLARATEACPVQNFILTIRAETDAQLRASFPNPWEVFWIFFNYIPDGENKQTNYLVLKTNGLELGRAFGASDQAFLFTNSQPVLTVGEVYEYVLEKRGGNLIFKLNGQTILTYLSQDFPVALYEHPGAIGLYLEDARAIISSVQLLSLDDNDCF